MLSSWILASFLEGKHEPLLEIPGYLKHDHVWNKQLGHAYFIVLIKKSFYFHTVLNSWKEKFNNMHQMLVQPQ